MKSNTIVKTLAVTSLVALGATACTSNPFQANGMDKGYEMKKGENKCGEGKCGADMKKNDGSCAANKKSDAKCGEGKCGANKKQ
ncbi:MAG: low-complexity protein [Gammaproteobacteria bacterium]|nr:MAG: low-complexity protein [Gammaproteobacteria bacterium]